MGATETVRADELVEGDVVRTHGLRVRIGRVSTSERHELAPVLHAPGTILNPEYLSTDTGRYLFGGIIALDGSDLSWTIQSTAWVRWCREVSA